MNENQDKCPIYAWLLPQHMTINNNNNLENKVQIHTVNSYSQMDIH